MKKRSPSLLSAIAGLRYCCILTIIFLLMRSDQGHSGGNKVGPSLQVNVEIPSNWIDHIYHVGSSQDCHSINRSDQIAGGKDTKEGRQSVFFTAVDAMNQLQKDLCDVTLPSTPSWPRPRSANPSCTSGAERTRSRSTQRRSPCTSCPTPNTVTPLNCSASTPIAKDGFGRERSG